MLGACGVEVYLQRLYEPVNTKVVSPKPAHGEVCSIPILIDNNCHFVAICFGTLLFLLIFPQNKCHDITNSAETSIKHYQSTNKHYQSTNKH